MKQVLVYVGIWFLCLQLAYARQCYYCPAETLSSECTDIITCPVNKTTCKTTVKSEIVGYPFDGTEVVIRGCSTDQSCLTSGEDLGIDSPVFCCKDDLCNNRGVYVNSSAITIMSATGISVMGISVALIILGL